MLIPMLIHVALLYGSCAAAVVLTIATWGPRPRPLWLVWPFFALGFLDMLLLTARGHLIFQWLVPLLTMMFVAECTRSDALVKGVHRALVAAAFVCMVHGRGMIGHGYVGTGRPVVVLPGEHVGTAWFSRVTGLYPLTGKPAPPTRPAPGP
jgi:hypothetical protein